MSGFLGWRTHTVLCCLGRIYVPGRILYPCGRQNRDCRTLCHWPQFSHPQNGLTNLSFLTRVLPELGIIMKRPKNGEAIPKPLPGVPSRGGTRCPLTFVCGGVGLRAMSVGCLTSERTLLKVLSPSNLLPCFI